MKYSTAIAIFALTITLVLGSSTDEKKDATGEQLSDDNLLDDLLEDLTPVGDTYISPSIPTAVQNIDYPNKEDDEVIDELMSLIDEENKKDKEGKQKLKESKKKGIKKWTWPRLIAAVSILACIVILIIMVPVMICTGSCCCCP